MLDDRSLPGAICTYRHDSVLGRWQVSMCLPHPALRGIVQQLWIGRGQVAYARDRILPRAVSYLLINLGPPQFLVEPYGTGLRTEFRDIWYSGLHQRPLDTEAPHGSEVLGIAFHASGAARVLAGDQHEWVNRTGPLEDAIGPSARVLRERLLDATGAERRFAIVQGWLLQRCAAQDEVHPAVRQALRALRRSAGCVRVASLARDTGYSRKHLRQLFREEVGLTPKALARVLRFQRAIGQLQGGAPPDWPALALQCGYYDQSHLWRDLQAHAGLTPRDLLQHAWVDPVSVVLR